MILAMSLAWTVCVGYFTNCPACAERVIATLVQEIRLPPHTKVRLIGALVKPGMTEKQVQELIGTEAYDVESLGLLGFSYHYHGAGLVVFFDEDGKVVRRKLLRLGNSGHGQLKVPGLQ